VHHCSRVLGIMLSRRLNTRLLLNLMWEDLQLGLPYSSAIRCALHGSNETYRLGIAGKAWITVPLIVAVRTFLLHFG
jgi:hypothetical protein